MVVLWVFITAPCVVAVVYGFYKRSIYILFLNMGSVLLQECCRLVCLQTIVIVSWMAEHRNSN